MNKNEYLALKKYIKTLCKDSVIELSQNVGLTQYDTDLLLYLNSDTGRIQTSLLLGICERKYTKDLKLCLGKVYDYLKRTSD